MSWDTQSGSILVPNPSEMKDYYLKDPTGEYVHIRYVDDAFKIISTPTVVVSVLPTDGSIAINYILDDDVEFKSYKYIDDAYVLISDTPYEIISVEYSIDYYEHGTPADNELLPIDYLEEKYLDMDAMVVYEPEEVDENVYEWTSTTLISSPNGRKDYFVQFGEDASFLHFRYQDDKFVQVGSLADTKDETDAIIR